MASTLGTSPRRRSCSYCFPNLDDWVIAAVQHRVKLEGERAHVVGAGALPTLDSLGSSGSPACPCPVTYTLNLPPVSPAGWRCL